MPGPFRAFDANEKEAIALRGCSRTRQDVPDGTHGLLGSGIASYLPDGLSGSLTILHGSQPWRFVKGAVRRCRDATRCLVPTSCSLTGANYFPAVALLAHISRPIRTGSHGNRRECEECDESKRKALHFDLPFSPKMGI